MKPTASAGTVPVEIKHRLTGRVLFATDVDADDAQPMRTALQRATEARANLAGANLAGANLADANLAGAYLAGAYLAGAYLAYANLADADLTGTNIARACLTGACLTDANLADANLAGAYLAGANLADADLTGTDLAGAYLTGADLAYANLARIREDVRRVLDRAPAEVAGLLVKLRSGEVDGSCYEGACACLIGTIANIRGVNFDALEGIEPSSSSPAEKWFTGIGEGSTPDNNPVAAITEDWILEWQAERGEGDWIVSAPKQQTSEVQP